MLSFDEDAAWTANTSSLCLADRLVLFTNAYDLLCSTARLANELVLIMSNMCHLSLLRMYTPFYGATLSFFYHILSLEPYDLPSRATIIFFFAIIASIRAVRGSLSHIHTTLRCIQKSNRPSGVLLSGT